MNKMGLAAIVYDTQHIKTTAGFVKPDVEGHIEGHSSLDNGHVYYSESDDENDIGSLSPEMAKHSLNPSPVSSHSSKEDITETDVEKDDLICHFAHIRRANLDIDGQSALARRTHSLSKALQLDITNTHELELHRKYYSLRRTLKVKQHELLVIDKLMEHEPITASKLDHFKDAYPDIIESLMNPDDTCSVSSDGSIRYDPRGQNDLQKMHKQQDVSQLRGRHAVNLSESNNRRQSIVFARDHIYVENPSYVMDHC
ncbi:hypothetical protein LSH36_537g02061 [Paralvinella palmiformis]|uniref:Uncharacterized protein n=1 Tax=Paralvinella palmiformis TaxID=53620 RepID=A0AAD9MW86_9ANNE|nr:hypothetical protein LSH36_537g02061 [Paralvinella palmiformis]